MFRLLTCTFTALMLLTACGGGAGGQGAMPNVEGGPMDDSMTRPTSNEVREALARIGSTADRLFLTDQVETSRSPGSGRSEFVCQGASCTIDWLGLGVATTSVTISDLSSIDANATVHPGTPIHGVPSGEIRGQIVRADPAREWRSITDYTIFGGWLEKSFFGVQLGDVRTTLQGDQSEFEGIYAFSLGEMSGTNPVSGSATWRGAMVGRDDANPAQTVTGHAALTYDFVGNTVDLTMSQIRGSQTYADMTWQGLAVSGGQFGSGSDSNSLEGTFYGDNHEEVGGIFEQNQIVGAFGASRQ